MQSNIVQGKKQLVNEIITSFWWRKKRNHTHSNVFFHYGVDRDGREIYKHVDFVE